jgi:[FeFe] hydrogenase H-cluster maturation GTPase HydF
MSKFTDRTLISFVGRTNAGKSSLLNLLSGQKDYAIVDATPGTTTDNVITVMEIHDLGAVKLIDTAGVDEYSELGDKKRKKTYEAIEEADLNLVVLNPKLAVEDGVEIEKELIDRIQNHNKQCLIVYNIFDSSDEKHVEEIHRKLSDSHPYICLNISDFSNQTQLIEFIKTHYVKNDKIVDLLPNLGDRGYAVLVIPMDEETPALRLLRPQDMVIERLLRNFKVPVLYRMNLDKARSSQTSKEHNEEKERFHSLLNDLKKSEEGLSLVITDSQAIDVVSEFVPEDINLTTFSVVMSNYMSMGNLNILTSSLGALDDLKSDGGRVLIIEACNHDRKCNDIGTVQIPKLLKNKINANIEIDFNFGRTFPDEEELKKYKLIISCGSCMIDRQKFQARIKRAIASGVGFTNYGLLLSYLKDKDLAKRVISIFE